jgi:hypothetical protein
LSSILYPQYLLQSMPWNDMILRIGLIFPSYSISLVADGTKEGFFKSEYFF